MDIQFQGLNPVISAPLLFLLIFCSVLFAWWSYSYLKSLPTVRRWILIILRSLALIILLLLLLNPYLQIDDIDYHIPEIAVYFDDSKSMSIQRGNYDGWESYQQIIESFEFNELEDFSIQYYRFSNLVESADGPDLELEGGTTNLDEVMRHIRDRSDETVAALLFSDGIVTRGRDPVFSARDLHLPLYTVPVGDTSDTRDIAVSDVITNETGYVNTSQPVEVTVTQEGFTGENVSVRLHKDGQLLDSENLQLGEEGIVHRTTFNILFEEAGLHNFEVHVSELEGEITTENNLYPFSVNVIDEKTNIYYLAFEIHPDVRGIRSVLESDRNIELHPYTWIGNRFIEGSIDEIRDDMELLVIHGAIPDQAFLPDGITDQTPVLQILTPGISAADLASAVIPLTVTNSGSMLSVHLDPTNSSVNHPVTELETIEYARQPTLITRQATYDFPATSTVLYHAIYSGTETEIPVVIIEEAGNIRRALINAAGWYRYLQSANEQTREFAYRLIANVASWTATDPDSRNLRIEPGKRIYQEGEEITFRGDLVNETGEPETDAIIEVTLIDQDNSERSFSMIHRSNGHYTLAAGTMAAGNYEFIANARKADREIDTISGEFSVTPSTLELVNTKRDDNMLESLAEITNGSIFHEYGRENLINELNDRNLVQPIEEIRTSFRFLYESYFWFIIVMVLLTVEWLIRRKSSLP
jgi:hypothetical protein